MTVRDATAEDLEPIRAIFNHAVAHTTAIWSETPRTQAEQAAWFAEKTFAGWPVLAATGGNDGGGDVLGFAALGPFRPQPGIPPHRGARRLRRPNRPAAGAWGGRCSRGCWSGRRRGGCETSSAWCPRTTPPVSPCTPRSGSREVGLLPGVGEKWGRTLDAVFVQRVVGPRQSGAGVRSAAGRRPR